MRCNPKQRAAWWTRGRGPFNTCAASGCWGTKATRPAGKYSTLTVPFPLAGASSLPFSFAASAASSTTSFFSFRSWNNAEVYRLINIHKQCSVCLFHIDSIGVFFMVVKGKVCFREVLPHPHTHRWGTDHTHQLDDCLLKYIKWQTNTRVMKTTFGFKYTFRNYAIFLFMIYLSFSTL